MTKKELDAAWRNADRLTSWQCTASIAGYRSVRSTTQWSCIIAQNSIIILRRCCCVHSVACPSGWILPSQRKTTWLFIKPNSALEEAINVVLSQDAYNARRRWPSWISLTVRDVRASTVYSTAWRRIMSAEAVHLWRSGKWDGQLNLTDTAWP